MRGYTKPMVTERESDAAVSSAQRVDDLLARMTLDEKLAQLGSVWAFHVVKDILSTRITYGTNTLEGSSGSPCFNYRWDLVAIHHSGDPTYSAKRNQGVPIEQIFKLLTSRGVSLQ